MYVAQNRTSHECFVVIRGTNPYSLYSWLYEDFNVENVRLFSDLSGVPSNALTDVYISEGTFLGMQYLVHMVDPKRGHQTLIQFLAGLNAGSINVTGHSLGGTLTPTMLLYIDAVLKQAGVPVPTLGVTSFAGLPAGGHQFNTSFNTAFTGGYNWRYANNLDIAPLMWINKQAVLDIYQSYGLTLDYLSVVRLAIDRYFHQAAKAPITYEQPGGGGAHSREYLI